MRVAADRLSVRWYPGYDPHEPLPDHSSLTRIRERYGLRTVRRFFEEIVRKCTEAGRVWGKELYFDATKIEANASLESITPRFAVEQHLQDLFEEYPKTRAATRAARRELPSGISTRFRRPKTRSSPPPTPPKAIGSRRRGAKTAK